MHSQTFPLHSATSLTSQLRSSLHAVLTLLSPRPAQTRPAIPKTLREAAALREYAATFQRSDPRFAADLYAAADRHEGVV